MNIKINNIVIGNNTRTFIIAELSGNHKQNYNTAIKTIRAIKKCGADAIKLQTYTPDTITIDSNKKDFMINQKTLWDGKSFYELYKEAYTPWDWQPKLKKYAESLGLICFSSPFDKTAVDFLEKMNVPAYKIASYEITDIPLIEYIASKNKPVIISTGIAGLKDIKDAIRACYKQHNKQVILLKCTSAYPTPIEEVNLNAIPDLAKKFKLIIGLSDHTQGIEVPIAAVAIGAKIIEKHFILDRKLGGPDAQFSLEPTEFKQMVDAIRNTEKALGKINYKLSTNMKKSREFARSLYVVSDIKKGESITELNVRSIRPGFGLHPKYLPKVLGKVAKKAIEKGTPLNWRIIS